MDRFPFGSSRIASAIDFIEAPFDCSLQGYLDVRKRIDANIGLHAQSFNVRCYDKLSVAEKLKIIEPVVISGPSHILLTQTRSRWCCAWGNDINGITPLPHIEMAAESLGTRFVRVVANNEKGLESFQFIVMSFNGARVGRVVYAHHEGGWQFFQHGDPLPFELLEKYTERRKRDRLTPGMISSYCLSLGIDVCSADFYDGQCAVIDYPSMVSSPPFDN